EPPADGQEPEDTEGPGDEGTETPQAAVADSDDDAGAAELEAEEDPLQRPTSWDEDFVSATQKHATIARPCGDPDISRLRAPELVAESAAIPSEAPYRSRHLFVPLPRAAASEGWEQTVEALNSAPWIDPTGVDELLDSSVESRGLLHTPSDAPHIRTKAVKSLAETRADQEDFNSVFTDQEAADIRLDRELLSCTSAAWTLGRNANICADAAREQSRDLMDSLHLRKGSSIL